MEITDSLIKDIIKLFSTIQKVHLYDIHVTMHKLNTSYQIFSLNKEIFGK